MNMADLSLILLYEAESQVISIGFQNDTSYQFILDGEITFNGPDPIAMKGNIAPQAKVIMGKIPFDQINDYPHFEIDLERHSTQGHEETLEIKIKPKPKHFIKLSLQKKWGNKPGRTYHLWKESDWKSSKIISETKKSQFQPSSEKTFQKKIYTDLSELAVFNRELDLHAKKLFSDLNSVTPEAIYQKQIKTFHWYMNKAKSMNIDRVFIIHGVGSGRLKSEIATKLEYDPAVKSYSNEYHSKYGFGATEVVFV